MLDDETVSTRSRMLATMVEPIAAQVYFSPECHAAYEALGFGPSPGMTGGKVALPDGPAYFTSRGSVMGQVAGEVIAAAFAVFNPAVVVAAVNHGWSLTDAPTICSARTQGAVAQLTRILGAEPAGVERACELLQRATEPLRPEGRPLYAGLRSLGLPGEPLADAWRLADMLREYRGDAHIAAWTSTGFDAVEIGLVTELFWGLPMGSYIRTRAWSKDQLEEAKERLRERGLIDGDGFTEVGRESREHLEGLTDQQCRPVIEALGDDFDELVGILEPWARAVQDAGGYLPAGPHDLARRSS
jgi:hypothetical protein